MGEIIKFDDSVSTQALTDLQEHVKLLPVVITSESEFKSVYENYQNVRRLRIAVNKQGVALISGAKKTFLDLKSEIENKEFRITKILGPIETDLKTRREIWKTKKKNIADKKAAKIAAEQQAEFERQEKIRIEFYIDEIWDLAHGMNIDLDLEKAEVAKREADLKKRELEVEAREKELELQEKERIQVAKYDNDWNKAHEINEDFDARMLAEKLDDGPESKEDYYPEDELADVSVLVTDESGASHSEQNQIDKNLMNAALGNPDMEIIDRTDLGDKVVDDPTAPIGHTQCPHCKKYFQGGRINFKFLKGG